MGLRDLIVACTLLALCSADQIFTTVNSMLDPNRITWWRSKWAPAPVVLSVNNSGKTPVAATFFFCPTTTVTAGIFEVTFPSSFTLTGTLGASVNGVALTVAGTVSVTGSVVQVAATLSGGSDSQITITGITNPTAAGAVGPFALRTRYFSDGQQVDVNLSFATVYIAGATTNISNLKVVLVTSTVNQVNKPSGTLSFQFNISTQLWRYDTFVINIDSSWTIASSATCNSFDYAGKYNNFNGTNTANPHSLQCVTSARTTTSTTAVSTGLTTITGTVANVVYIYGLAVDGIDFLTSTDNQFVDLRVNSVTNPDSAGSTYTFTVSTFRFGTYTMLDTGTSTTVPTIIADTLTTVSWVSTWGLNLATEAIPAQTYYFDLSVTLQNKLANGAVDIVITETFTADTTNWVAPSCYVISPIYKSVVCAIISATNLQITNLPDLAASSVVKARVLVNFSSAASATAKISTVKTYKGGITGPQVDGGSSFGSFPLAATTAGGPALLSFSYLDSNAAGTTPITTAGGIPVTAAQKNTLQFGVYASTFSTAPTSATSFEIKCPMAGSISDMLIGVTSPAYQFQQPAATTVVTAIAPNASWTTPTTAPTGTYSGTDTVSTSATPGSITFTGSVCGASCSVNTIFIQVVPGSGTTAISLPKVATNIATAYECRLAITSTTSGVIPARTAIRFKVAPQLWTPTTSTFTIACTSNVNGMPVIFNLLASIFAVAATATGETYYVEFEFPSTAATIGFGAGLTAPTNTAPVGLLDAAMTYTGYIGTASTTSTVQLYTTATSTIVLFPAPAIAATGSTTVQFIFPIGGAISGAGLLAPTARSFYLYNADTRYKFINFETTFSGLTLTSPTPAFGSTAVITGGGSMVNGTVPSAALGLYLVLAAGTAPASGHYIYFVLPTGFTWSSSKAVKNTIAGTSGISYVTSAYYFSVPSAKFTFPGVAIYTVESSTSYPITTTVGTNTTPTITITGLTPPLGVASALPISAVSGNLSSGVCTGAITSLTLATTVGLISITSVNPNSVTARGASGVNIHLAVAFQVTHGLPAGGSIVIAYDGSNWGIHSSSACGYCTVTGLTPLLTFTTTTMCTLGAGSVTIANFADFQGSSPPAITVDIYGLLTPVTATGTGSGSAFITSINTYTGTSYQGTSNQVDNSSGTGSAITVTTAIAPAAITWTTKKTFPTTVSMLGVDLYLKFSIPHTLPRCGLITITSPLPYKLTGDLLNSCFLSPTQYWYCKINGSAIEIQVGQDYIGGTTMELYLDAAVDNASTTTASTTGFQITTAWGTQTIDTDGSTITSSQTIAATGSLTSTITGSSTASLTFVPKTSGEVATYTFDFKDSVNFAANDQYWIVFPPQYDYFLGDTWTWLTNESNVYYIDCSSTQLGTTWCTVDHNIVVVTGSNAITGSTQIVISIQGVINPPAAVTNNFQIYHVDSNGAFVTVNQSYGTVTASAFAGELDVRSLVQSDRRIFKSSDMVWRLYIVDTVGTDGQLKVLFPREYDLNKFDKKDSYSCSSTWLDIGASATIKTQQSWNSASSCTASGNWITLGAPTTSYTFSYTHIVTWTIQSTGNPQWGQPRSAVSLTQLDFDVTDAVLWPLDPMWVSKFTFFVYKSAATSLTYSSRSYPNMNAAYAGFIMTYRQLLVNNYGPQMKTNRIVVRAGTQSTDLYIATTGTAYPMAAKQIVFTPTTNSRTADSGKLRYTSVVDNWTLFQSFYKIQFRVAAGIDMIKGLYYIDWSNNETKQTGMSDVQYDIPCSTLVEVIAKTASSYTYAVSTIPNVSTGYTSVPIKISIVNAPHTDCTINISVSGTPANISINPTALTFGPDVNEKYFQIQVASNYDLTLGTVQSLLFSLTGTDSYAFAIASSLKFTITQASTTITPGNIVSWGLGTPAKTIMSVTPSADQTGVIYYCLAAAGTVVPSFSSLKSSVQALVGANSTNSSPAPSVGANTQSDPQTGETWVDFQRRLYKSHLESTWTGTVSMYATTAVKTLSFTWLWAATSYQISGYLDNLSSSTIDPTVRTETFTTTATADCQPFVVKFQGTVASSFQTKISQEAANGMGVNPLRLTSPTFATTTSRELDTTGTTTTVAFSTFTYTLLPNRFSESPAPADQAKLTGTALTTFTAALIAGGISNTLNSIANGAVPSRVTPQWTASPSSGGSTTNSITVSLRANVAGQSCCVALTGTTTSPNPEQVMLGLDSTNTAASSTCITTDLTQSSNSVQVSSLQAGTAYYVYCSATDSYPMWPTQMSYSTTNPMAPVSITTLGSAPVVVTSASYFGGLFLLLAFLLH